MIRDDQSADLAPKLGKLLARPYDATLMESYVLKYKLRRFAGRLWYWTRQLLLFALLAGALLLAWQWQDRTTEHITSGEGDVVHVLDGDSLTIGSGKDLRTIRLQEIDAPEYRQTCRDARGVSWACGKDARSALQSIVKAGGLRCKVAATDSYHRIIGTCAVPGVDDIGREMVRRGMAVSGAETTTSRFNDGGPYLREEAEAAREKRGLWRGQFDRPADWRAAAKQKTADAVNSQ